MIRSHGDRLRAMADRDIEKDVSKDYFIDTLRRLANG